MSDDDSKKPGGYRLEYASSGRSKCTAIPKGALRLGSQIEFRGNTTFVWRHWGCVTSQNIANFKKSFESADELDGFDELKEVDKERVRTAWEQGKVADEDIPESAKRGDGDGEEEEEEEAKPKKKRAPAKKKAKKDDSGGEDDAKPKKKAPAKKAPAKKKATKKKKDSETEGEDFDEELENVSDDEVDADDDAESGKKRKRSSAKKPAASKKTKKSKKEVTSDADDE